MMRNWNVVIVESSRNDGDLNLSDEAENQEMHNSDYCEDTEKGDKSAYNGTKLDDQACPSDQGSDKYSEIHHEDVPVMEEGPVKEDTGRREEPLEVQSDSNIQDDVTTSLINPPTPRDTSYPETDNQQLLSSCIQEGIIQNSMLSNWIPRDKDTSTSLLRSRSEEEESIVEDSLEYDREIMSADHLKVLHDMEKLKVKSRRGRPRSCKRNTLNKHFKLPKRRKKKGEGLKQISHFCLNNSLSEVESIYETGVLMGLLPLNDKEKSMELILRNLKD
ncbi:hypothetical protein DCAR_0624144 [Daucus carota subsp. sativus]|uniref:Uncharacterized protein n=1 Tax=Daucus carota subsp. sativus TaxID=79200 RepID=A0A161ZUW3_DAUCS|nr:hypothetical protein DCAR_0624144 [Daucus carota subsp. sativus]